MALVVGTAGHIDHGKTTLLHALTGIDADRLPEEQRRGMTIDVGYAHLDLPDGGAIDFVDVPGHDRLIGNMLVGAGEIDAALLVVAADDGPRPQTLEHLELLDSLGIAAGIAAITKADLVDDEALASRIAEAGRLLARTSLAGAPVLAVSATTRRGLDALRDRLVALAETAPVAGVVRGGRTRLAVDRAFAVRGRGVVVTGSLRGGAVERNETLRLEPDGREVRVREVQVHGARADRASAGRVALNLAASDASDLRRGQVLAARDVVVATRRLLVALAPAVDLAGSGTRGLPLHGERLRLHLGTDAAEAIVVRNGRTAADLPGDGTTALLRLDRPVAAAFGDRFVLRRPSPGATAAGGHVLDPLPPLGPSRRYASPAALAALAAVAPAVCPSAEPEAFVTALVRLHGALPGSRIRALRGARPGNDVVALGPLLADPSVLETAGAAAIEAVASHASAEPLAGGLPLASLRAGVVRDLRRRVSVDRSDAAAAAAALIDRLGVSGRLVIAGDRVRLPGQSAELPDPVLSAMARVETALSVAAPPPLSEVVRAAACPPEGLRALEAADRIVRLEPEIAYARETYGRLAALAIRLASAAPLSPAAFRDATGTSRKYALAILEDLDRRGLLQRTPGGHVPGPRAPRAAAPSAGAPRS